MERLPLFDDKFPEKFLIPHIQQIADMVRSKIDQTSQPGWMTGLAGMAIFLAEYEHGMGLAPAPDPAHVLARIVEVINDGFAYPTMAAGLAGIVWTFHYLGDRGYLSPADATALDELLPFIKRFTHHAFKEGNPDALHGAIGPYITRILQINDLPGDGSGPRAGSASQYHHPIPGWPGTGAAPHQGQNLDLGLAHGLPSWLLFLDAVNDPDFDQALDLLLSFRSPDEISSFPTRIKNGKPESPSRLAWCYGDVGIGMSLIRLGRYHQVCWDVGLEVLEKAAGRFDPKDTRVGDPYFCHGASGLAFMFYKAWVLSKNDKLRLAAQHWTKETIRMLETSHPAGKEYQLSGVTFGDGSLLNGLSGIGLSLMAVYGGSMPHWESGLMI